MWLLTFSVVLFIIVIAMIIYANWPAQSSGVSCGGGCGGGCPKCPCRQCGMPRPRCRCQSPSGGCPFC